MFILESGVYASLFLMLHTIGASSEEAIQTNSKGGNK